MGIPTLRFGIYKKIEPFPYFLKFDEANYIDGLKTGMFFNED
jgi:hypothetical protein